MSVKKAILTVLLTGWCLYFCGCQKSMSPVEPTLTESGPTAGEGMMILGKRLQNPYSVKNMIKARDNLVAKGIIGDTDINQDDLKATHYYIRFKPADKQQLDLLESDESLVLWDYPLDYVIQQNGNCYRDPETSPDKPEYKYTAVRIDSKLPPVDYEILEELILEPENVAQAKGTMGKYYSLLEREALKITGNLKASKEEQGKWRPSGTIKLYDDVLKTHIPMITVNVRVRNWFKWWDGYTDGNGSFVSPKEYYGDVAYSLRWQYIDNMFDIRTGSIGQAFYNGPNNSRSPWNLNIGPGGASWAYANVYRAGSYYIGQEPYGLSDHPFSAVSVCVYDEPKPSGESNHYNPVNENIIIYDRATNGAWLHSLLFFSVTVHEMAHAHHDEIYSGGSYNLNVVSRLSESWGIAVQYYMSRMVYPESLVGWYAKQSYQNGDTTSYTPLMVDLIDNYNQFQPNMEYLRDDVWGYTLHQMEQIISKPDCNTVEDFKRLVWALPMPVPGMHPRYLGSYLCYY